MRRFSATVRDEQGATLVLVALSITALLGFLALAVDVGMLYSARAEAQRAADAAALAGASAYLGGVDPQEAVPQVDARARDFAGRNAIQHTLIDPTPTKDPWEVQVVTEPADFKVTVTVRRPAIPLWFARVLGFETADVAAQAVAVATDAGAATCVRPWAVPDRWVEINADGLITEEEYSPWDGNPLNADSTGYGSAMFNDSEHTNDIGRQLTLKLADPTESEAEPGIFYPWVLPSTGSGAAAYRDNIASCNPDMIVLGEEYDLQTGNMVGPTNQGTDDLVAQDPYARWSSEHEKVVDCGPCDDGDGWMDSPRVVKIALFDPAQINKSGKQTISFNNFALFFVEGQESPQDPVLGRFLYFADGAPGASGTTAGTLTKTIRLVQ